MDYYGGSQQILFFAINGAATPDILTKYRLTDYPSFLHILPNMDCNAIDIYTDSEFSYTPVLDWLLKRIEGIVSPIRMPLKLEA